MKNKELVLLLLIIFVIPIAAQQVPLDARLRGGKIHFQGGRYEKALEQFSAALIDFPGNPEVRFWKGLTLEKLGKNLEAAANFDTTFTDALEWLTKTQDDEYQQYTVWNTFIKAGQSMEKANDLITAVKFYKRATEVSPTSTQSYIYLTQVYTTLDSLSAIKRVAEELFVVDPQNPLVNVLLGQFYFKKADWDLSLVYYGKAIAAFKKDWNTIENNIGKELKLDSTKTLAVAEKLLEVRKQKTLETYINDSLKAKSKLQSLAKMTDQLFALGYELNGYYSYLGEAALQKATSLSQDSLQQKYFNQAENFFIEALRYYPLDYSPRYNLAMIYSREGLDVKAESIYNDLVSSVLTPLSAIPVPLSDSLLSKITLNDINLGYIEITAGSILDEIEKAAEIKKMFNTGAWYLYFIDFIKSKELPNNKDNIFLGSIQPKVLEELLLFLGGNQTILKQYDDAIKTFNLVLNLNPKNQDALRNLAVCYREKGDQKKAYEILQEMEKIQKQK